MRRPPPGIIDRLPNRRHPHGSRPTQPHRERPPGPRRAIGRAPEVSLTTTRRSRAWSKSAGPSRTRASGTTPSAPRSSARNAAPSRAPSTPGEDRVRPEGLGRSSSRSRRRRATTTRSPPCAPTWTPWSKLVEDLEFRRMFSNPMDPNNCFMDINAGPGGTEAQDWAAMLLRMYLKYCDKQGLQGGGARGERRRGRGHQERLAQGDRRVCLRLPAHRDRHPPAGAQVARSTPTPAATPRSRACSSTPRWTTRSRSRSTRRTCASTPTAPRARAASTSTRPTRRCASRTCRPTSWCRARTTARSTATAPRRCRC